jgi:hypothetical protein
MPAHHRSSKSSAALPFTIVLGLTRRDRARFAPTSAQEGQQ